MEVAEAPVFGEDYNADDIVNSINSSVSKYLPGVDISLETWLNMGSPSWQKTSTELKQQAYEFAVKDGWTEDALRGVVKVKFPHLSQAMIDLTFTILKNKQDAKG